MHCRTRRGGQRRDEASREDLPRHDGNVITVYFDGDQPLWDFQALIRPEVDDWRIGQLFRLFEVLAGGSMERRAHR